MTDPTDRIIVALDYPDLDPALAMADLIGSRVGMLKIGLELFNSVGPPAIAAVRARGARVFYDCKFSDIPNTVAGAAAAAVRMGVSMFNVHSLGGLNMMVAAREAAHRTAAEMEVPPPLIIGVTILTSLTDTEVQRDLGIPQSASHAALHLALLSKEAGLDGVVASVSEVGEIKQACGMDFLTVTPGIRPSGATVGDQARIATPRAALAAGTDYLVIGRPITRAPEPDQALTDILREMSG
ncbi:MAG: orotidine-5'-phosphate decarboxylase [Armatimonadetes bacterium]|nr:orotidine-5'-phosphate decarboxylase [Armatimonadota bacterium]